MTDIETLKGQQIKQLESLLKKKMLLESELKCKNIEKELELFNNETILTEKEIETVNKAILYNKEEEINKLVKEILNLETKLSIIHPQSAQLFMHELIYFNRNHLFHKDVKEKFIKEKEKINLEIKSDIRKSIKIMTELCNYDFSDMMSTYCYKL